MQPKNAVLRMNAGGLVAMTAESLKGKDDQSAATLYREAVRYWEEVLSLFGDTDKGKALRAQ